MRRKTKAWAIVLMSLVLAFSIALGMPVTAEDGQNEELVGSEVLKLTVDFGEQYNAEGRKYVNLSFAKIQSDEGAKVFAAGDVISYEIYSPDIDAGGLDAQVFTPLDADPWASDWGWMRDDSGMNSSWAIAGGKTGFETRTLTVGETSPLIGKRTNFFSVIYETAAAVSRQTVEIYYRNLVVRDASGAIKWTVLNNSAAHNVYTDFAETEGIASAKVERVTDPFAPAFETADRVLALTVDLGENYASGTEKIVQVRFATPADTGALLSEGDFLEYEIYSPANIHACLDGQVATSWAFLRSYTMREMSKSNVSPSWDTLDYNAANGDTTAADLSQGWFTRRMTIESGSPLIGQNVYHFSLYYSTTNRQDLPQTFTVYFRNIRVRNVDNEILYNVFDGTQAANEVVSIPWETHSAEVTASISVVNDPLEHVIERAVRSAQDKYLSLKLTNNDQALKTFEAEVLDGQDLIVQEGDCFTYAFTMDEALAGLGNLDLLFTDGTRLSDLSLQDTYGFAVAADTDFGKLALKNEYTNPWVVRTVDLSEAAGKTVQSVLFTAELPETFAEGSAVVTFDKIGVRRGGETVWYYQSADYDSGYLKNVSGTLAGMVGEEPLLEPDTAPAQYVTFRYTLDDMEADVSRHYNLSLFGYLANPCFLSVGDRVYFDVMTDQVLSNANVGIFNYQINGGTWTTLSDQSVTDQRGLQTEDSSFITEAGKWYTRYFDIELESLAYPIGHYIISAFVNGPQAVSEFSVSIANLYIAKADGSRVDLISNGRTVFEGSIDRFGLASEYASGMDLAGVDTVGYQPPEQAAPEKYIQVDYTVAGLSVGEVQSREHYLSLFGAEFTELVLQEGDVLSYDFNLSAPLTGVGMLDMQVVSTSDPSDPYEGKYLRDIAVARFNAGELLADNYGIQYAANSDVSWMAYGGWANRQVQIPSEFVGYRIQHLVLSLSNSSWLQGYQFSDATDDLIRKVTLLLGNIKILHADGTETVLFDGNGQKFQADKAMLLDASGEVICSYAQVPALVPPTITQPEESFRKLQPEDIAVAVDLKGKTFVSLTANGAELGEEDFALTDGVITLKKEFLGEQPDGEILFVLTTDEGSASFLLTVEQGEAPASCSSGCAAGASGLLFAALIAAVLKKKYF